MTYDWFNIFNLDDFEALGLVSRTYTQELEGYGEKSVLVTKGNVTSVTFEGEFMPINFNSFNPYERTDAAVAIDANNDVWVGIPVDEDEE